MIVPTPPKDSYNGAYCIFFLQGIGQLFPWNVFINAEDYFSRRFCGSRFEASFEDVFAFAYNLAAIMGLLVTLRFQQHRKPRGRIMGSLAVSLLTFVGCGVLVLVERASTGVLFFFTLGLIVISGLATAVLQGSLFAMASAFPPRYTQAMMAGQGLAGLTVALAGLFTTLAGPDDQSCIPELDPLPNSSRNRADFTDRYLTQDLEPPLESLCPAYSTDWNTLAYFGFAVLVLVGCMVSFPVLDHLPLTAFYTSAVGGNIVVEHVEVQNISEREVDGGNSDGGGWLPGRCETITPTTSSISFSYKPLAETPPKPLLALDTPLSDSRVFDKDEAAEQRRDDDVAVNGDHATTAMNRLRAKLAPISRYGFAVFFSFAVTLSLFPGATSEIVSSRQCQAGRSRFFAGDVFTMFSFVSFNAFDLLGRLAAGAALVLPKAWLPTAAVSRLVFIPLLLSCRSEHSRFRYWLSADAFPLSIMPVFAFTNGYVSSLSMMAGSQNGAWAGTAMVLFLSGGLLAGCALSFLVLFASTKS